MRENETDPVEQALARSQSMFRSPRMMDDGADPVHGIVVWRPGKSIWFSTMLVASLLLGPLHFTWSAFLLFLVTTAVTICLGHSIGMHRLLIHRSFDCPLWLERFFVYLGTLVGMAGPFGMIRQHDIRDWAQRKPACHPFLSHGSGFWRDCFWQLHCEFKLEKPPLLVIEKRVIVDRFYRFIDRSYMLQQLPWAALFYLIGGMPWLVWGIAVRITASLIGHWLIGYFAHNRGPQNWRVTSAGVQGYNVPFCGGLTMGEAWHNNHHAFPASARLGLRPGETDPGWWVLKALRRIGMVWNLKEPENLPQRTDISPVNQRMAADPNFVFSVARKLLSLLPHLLAGMLALWFAWEISRTPYISTGLQFIAPLAVIMLVHLVWLALSRGLKPGFSKLMLDRAGLTAVAGAGLVVLATLTAPMPSQATDLGTFVQGVLVVLFCLTVIASVVLVAFLVLKVILTVLSAAYRAATGKESGDGGNVVWDFGMVVFLLGSIMVASLEGTAFFARSDTSGSVTAERRVSAPPDAVWQALETATSPDFPLPQWLQVFPKPTAVLVDEGVGLGANRVVRFVGREGSGKLSMRVTERTEKRATFTVISDTSPIANWLTQRSLTYRVFSEEEGTRLLVTLNYERRLAPDWFFKPLSSFATYLAMDVLARDTKQRAEAL